MVVTCFNAPGGTAKAKSAGFSTGASSIVLHRACDTGSILSQSYLLLRLRLPWLQLCISDRGPFLIILMLPRLPLALAHPSLIIKQS